MSKLKGKKKLNKTISAQLAPFGISKARLSNTFAYHFDNCKVDFKITFGIEDAYFSEFIKERFGYDDNGNEFIISLLHEVGHHKANEEIEGLLLDFCESEKNRIETTMQTTTIEEEIKKLEWEYFNLPDEIMATAWAVKYAKVHPLEVQILTKIVEEALANFYKANEVTED